ncbi:MAG TPA: amidohydrolase family protein [Thermoanaerobaculales bacterium]|nr:amidohydrolase family protein [Thermoanaerobaculales bacterium]HQL29783.1 amidohydrolase family protein [Thermoanaerobaculales bacterium]
MRLEKVATEVDLRISGGVVLPMVEDGEWFRGDLLVDRGRIVEVVRGSSSAPARRTLDAGEAAVLPGFVQGHVHVVQSLLRHQADGLELLPWLRDAVWPYEAALDGDGVEAAAELGVAELLCGGTTTALDFGTCRHHERVFAVAERLGIRLVSGKTHMDTGVGVPARLLEDTDRSLADAAAIGDRWHGAAAGRLRYAVAPRFALSCSKELLAGCAALARARGWLLQSHANENPREVAAIREATGTTNVEYLHAVGLTGPDVVLAHGVHLDAREVALLAATRTTVCHCPGANLKLGSGIADVPGLRRAGVKVVLGADGAPCNNRLSIFHEMTLAATLHSLRHGPSAMPATAVLAMATREGAAALHLGDEIGTLEPGKAADVTVVDLRGWSMQPDGHPAARIVHGATAADVRHVVVDGRPVVVDRRLETADVGELRERIRSAWEATAARMGQAP